MLRYSGIVVRIISQLWMYLKTFAIHEDTAKATLDDGAESNTYHVTIC